MKINLPISTDSFLFGLIDPTDLLILSCFFIPLILAVYYVVVLSEEGESFLDPDYFNNVFKKRKRKVSEEDGDIEKNAYGEALKILDRARADSLKILGRAQVKAQGLLDNTYTISKENRKKLEDNLKVIYEKQERVMDNLSEELLEYYRQAIEEGKKENIRTLYEVTEAMKKEALQGVDELKEVVKKETMGAQDALQQKITSEYAKVDGEIKEYKNNKVEALNKKIFELLSNIHSEVLGEDLDQIKHEKLILELLDREVKKSGLRSSS
jgi:F0F1-type ATP synthase membrane subunit b/b'